jgi:hypothetical protein
MPVRPDDPEYRRARAPGIPPRYAEQGVNEALLAAGGLVEVSCFRGLQDSTGWHALNPDGVALRPGDAVELIAGESPGKRGQLGRVLRKVPLIAPDAFPGMGGMQSDEHWKAWRCQPQPPVK